MSADQPAIAATLRSYSSRRSVTHTRYHKSASARYIHKRTRKAEQALLEVLREFKKAQQENKKEKLGPGAMPRLNNKELKETRTDTQENPKEGGTASTIEDSATPQRQGKGPTP